MGVVLLGGRGQLGGMGLQESSEAWKREVTILVPREEKPQALHLWRCLKPDWTQPWTSCSG